VISRSRFRFAPRRAARALAWVAVVTTLAAAPSAWAEQADRNKPINFSGDTGDADLQARGGTLAGNVIITQGTLSIQDREGESTLEVRFSPRDLPSTPQGGRELLRVLVVDDDQDVRDVLSEMLLTAGHDVKVAGDGAEALRQAADGTFDIVFTDLGMPGISGWQVVEQIKRDAPGLPVVMVTGWGHQLDPSQVERSGVDRVLTKPFQWVKVLDTIHQLVPHRGRRHGQEQAH